MFDFYENWFDLNLPKLEEVRKTFKDFGMEYGYHYPEALFKNVAMPKVYDELKKEFAKVDELHAHKGSLDGGTIHDYNEEFYNRNKDMNIGSLGAGSSRTNPKVKVGKKYIAPERFKVKE